VFIYLRYVDRVPPLKFLRLTLNWKRGLLVGFVIAVIDFLGTLARLGPPDWHALSITWNSILSTSILIGFFEEIPFRGFILQKLQERLDFWTATLISSLLFVGAHLPGWIMLGQLRAYNVIFVFLFGTIMAVAFRYTKSLWTSIVAHSLNDFIASVIFRI
jgi:uncharacterized protein